MNDLFAQARDQYADLDWTLIELRSLVEKKQQEALALSKAADMANVGAEAFAAFLRKPYILRQIRADRYELIVPRFIDFQAGWPVRTEGEYVVYEVSRFIDLITPLPAWLRGELGYMPADFGAHLEGDWLHVDNGDPTAVWTKLGGGKRFSGRDGRRLRLAPRSRFDVLRDLVRLGVLPYRPQEIPDHLKRRGSSGITLRPQQERDYRLFEKYSAISIFATGDDRIATLRTFHERGIFTWVSLEPTLDVEASLAIIRATHKFVDLYKVGRVNYLPMTRTTDWADYTRRVIDLCAELGVRHYIKHDLQPFLPDGYPNPVRVPQHH